MQRDDRLRNRAELGIRTEHIIGERAKRARHSHVCSIENRGLLASERSERDTLWSVQLRIADILSQYIVRAIFVLITRKEGGA